MRTENLIKEYTATATLNQTVSGSYTLPFAMYAGPNQYQLLKTYGQGYEKAINFGWGIFRSYWSRGSSAYFQLARRLRFWLRFDHLDYGIDHQTGRLVR